MITHYGLFWSERDVFWGGHRNNPGQLRGRVKTQLDRRGAPTKEERDNAENFRDYVGVYCLYGGGDLLYIGETGLGTQEGTQETTLFNRLKTHREGPLSDRWDKFSWFGRKKCEGETKTEDALRQLEAISIAIINPGFNKQYGNFGNAVQVFQVPHPDAEGDIETKLARMADDITALRQATQ